MDSFKLLLAVKLNDEYKHVRHLPPSYATTKKRRVESALPLPTPSGARLSAPGESDHQTTIETIPMTLTESLRDLPMPESRNKSQDLAVLPMSREELTTPQNMQIVTTKLKGVAAMDMPDWHAPWKLYRVISGHLGWVRSIAVDPSNEWFATGAADRLIKIWDLASGKLKLTLTGHIGAVRGLAMHHKYPYLFSVGDDKTVKCWDLEQNKVIRNYHGHLSGVMCCAVHPTLDLLFTGGRDSVCRVWDIRTKCQVHVLDGHTNAISSVVSQATEPQVITGSNDTTIRTWDLAAGKKINVLTNHKKSIRSLVIHPTEYTFASAGADNVKKWQCPEGRFMHNFQPNNSILNAIVVNKDGAAAACGQDGRIHMYDWKTGYKFQSMQMPPQPGSLESDMGIMAAAYDMTGTRLITCESDKTIKMFKEDPDATPEQYPIDYKPELYKKY